MAFYKLSTKQRRAWLLNNGLINTRDHALLSGTQYHEIEQINSVCSGNVVGSWSLPFAVVHGLPLVL